MPHSITVSDIKILSQRITECHTMSQSVKLYHIVSLCHRVAHRV